MRKKIGYSFLAASLLMIFAVISSQADTANVKKRERFYSSFCGRSDLCLEEGKFLFNAEYRFPLWKKLGGNVFLDAGHIWPSWKEIDLMNSVLDFGWGLRYYLHNFVVRFDMGFSDEGTGVYFNFGHIF